MNEVKLLNIGGIDQNVKDQYARDIIAPSENGLDSTSNLPVASRHYDEGEYLIGQDRLYYVALTEINVGDTLVVNTNIKATTIAAELVDLKGQSADAAIECIAPMEITNLSTADYAVGRYIYWKHGLDTGLYKVIVPIVTGDAFVINTNIKASAPVGDAVSELVRINNEFGVKNLLPNKANNLEIVGVTFTVNPDGSVKLNGTATNDYYYRLFSQNFKFPNGKYILSGCPYGGSEGTYRLTLSKADSAIHDYGDGVEFEVNDDVYTQCFIKIFQGQTFTDLTFKPMIRPAYITDDTYEPYASSNQELTGEVEPMLNVFGAKNLLPNNATTQTINGVTFTVYSDGSVTANGKANGDAILYLYDSEFLTDNLLEINTHYIMTGCPSDGGMNKYRLETHLIYDGRAHLFNDFGDGIDIITPSASFRIVSAIYIHDGFTADHLKFYPMIRPASIKDGTYAPYAMTNRELTDEVTGEKNLSSQSVSLLSYTSSSNPYTIPNDGYIRAAYNSSGNNDGQIRFILSNNSSTSPLLSMKPSAQTVSLFVRKGMKVYLQNASMFYAVEYYPFI